MSADSTQEQKRLLYLWSEAIASPQQCRPIEVPVWPNWVELVRLEPSRCDRLYCPRDQATGRLPQFHKVVLLIDLTNTQKHHIIIRNQNNHASGMDGNLPAVLASLHASYMSCFISGLSSAIVSPTVTKRSTAKFTDCPTRPITRSVRSVDNECGRSDRCCPSVEI